MGRKVAKGGGRRHRRAQGRGQALGRQGDQHDLAGKDPQRDFVVDHVKKGVVAKGVRRRVKTDEQFRIGGNRDLDVFKGDRHADVRADVVRGDAGIPGCQHQGVGGDKQAPVFVEHPLPSVGAVMIRGHVDVAHAGCGPAEYRNGQNGLCGLRRFRSRWNADIADGLGFKGFFRFFRLSAVRHQGILKKDGQHHPAGPGQGGGQNRVPVQPFSGPVQFLQKPGLHLVDGFLKGRPGVSGRPGGCLCRRLQGRQKILAEPGLQGVDFHQPGIFFGLTVDNVKPDHRRAAPVDLVDALSDQGPGPGPPAQFFNGFIVDVNDHDGIGRIRAALHFHYGVVQLEPQGIKKFHPDKGDEEKGECQQQAEYKRRMVFYKIHSGPRLHPWLKLPKV